MRCSTGSHDYAPACERAGHEPGPLAASQGDARDLEVLGRLAVSWSVVARVASLAYRAFAFPPWKLERTRQGRA